MAIAIRSTPVLTEKAAVNFVIAAEKKSSKRKTFDFRKEMEKAAKILEKASI